MQQVIESMGFSYCGIIYVGDGSPRLAYQKKLFGYDAEAGKITVP
jgi:hypothetical protein